MKTITVKPDRFAVERVYVDGEHVGYFYKKGHLWYFENEDGSIVRSRMQKDDLKKAVLLWA